MWYCFFKREYHAAVAIFGFFLLLTYVTLITLAIQMILQNKFQWLLIFTLKLMYQITGSCLNFLGITEMVRWIAMLNMTIQLLPCFVFWQKGKAFLLYAKIFLLTIYSLMFMTSTFFQIKQLGFKQTLATWRKNYFFSTSGAFKGLREVSFSN